MAWISIDTTVDVDLTEYLDEISTEDLQAELDQRSNREPTELTELCDRLYTATICKDTALREQLIEQLIDQVLGRRLIQPEVS